MSDQLPGNPFAEVVDYALEAAYADRDTSDENISRHVTVGLARAGMAPPDDGDPPADLFDERESLSRIRDYARQRMVSPEGLLIKVLLRANVSAPAYVMIPGPPSPKPLCTAAVSVGRSGQGKTSSDDVAEDYWPAPIPEFPLGTAEGACQAFDPDEDGQPQEPNIIFASSEIDNWAALGERAGSLTFPVLRQILTGDQIGQKNASKAHTRIVNKRSYVAGLSLSAQPGGKGAGTLFADAPGGFPQRCLFGSEIDPDAPDEPPTGIEPYRPPHHPDFTPNTGDRYEIPFPASVIAEVHAHRRRVLRGDPDIDPLDGHRFLTRLRVTAALMILEGRNRATEDDWRIAGRIMDASDRTRATLVDAARRAARDVNRAKGWAVAERDAAASDHKMIRARQAILRWLGKHTQMAGADLRQKLKADIRDNFEPAAAELAEEGLIVELQVKNGVHYRIGSQGTGVPEGHPPNPQVSEGVPPGTGVPDATITDLDSRRSHETSPPKKSATKWVAHYIADRRAAGETTADSFAAYAQGIAAGYNRSALATAFSRHPDVLILDRTHKGAVWSITGEAGDYQPASTWIHTYLDNLPANTTTVDQDHYWHAARLAGYSVDAARYAALNCGRIDSIPSPHGDRRTTIWTVLPADQNTGS